MYKSRVSMTFDSGEIDAPPCYMSECWLSCTLRQPQQSNISHRRDQLYHPQRKPQSDRINHKHNIVLFFQVWRMGFVWLKEVKQKCIVCKKVNHSTQGNWHTQDTPINSIYIVYMYATFYMVIFAKVNWNDIYLF